MKVPEIKPSIEDYGFLTWIFCWRIMSTFSLKVSMSLPFCASSIKSSRIYIFSGKAFAGAMDAYVREISLPIYPDLSDEDLEYVVETMRKALT